MAPADRSRARPKPLSLFDAVRVDYSLAPPRPLHGQDLAQVQRFILLTNYQRYVDHFVGYARQEIADGDSFASFVEPGDVITPTRLADSPPSGSPPWHLPQMPAYHLDRAGPQRHHHGQHRHRASNARTITDHLAVLRPHCWLMLGHCAGLRRSQQLGDYVLAHAYAREDHVLDQDLPLFVAVPLIAEFRSPCSRPWSTSPDSRAVRSRPGCGPAPSRPPTIATGSCATTSCSSASISSWPSRSTWRALRSPPTASAPVPYGTLLCVSDKPLHGEIKLRGMANAFYEERINQHLLIGIEAIRILRDEVGPDQLHSRKLRSFDEPAFR